MIALCLTVFGQDVLRELKLSARTDVEVVNQYGRVNVKAGSADVEGQTAACRIRAVSEKGLSDNEVKITTRNGAIHIDVAPIDRNKRVDLELELPVRTSVKIKTAAGAVDIFGNLEKVEVFTDTGTIATDIPEDNISYHFLWTESRPRYLADFEIAEVKERSGGRFEIKGRRGEEEKGRKGEMETVPAEDQIPKAKDETPKGVTLNFTTARGIILLNVPPAEVGSDLRERPLTNAAKAIVRSGDSLLMEAIRRAAPKYYGEYAKSLPPIKFEPRFAQKKTHLEMPAAELKRATVRVTDLANRAISGLKADDFDVAESGQAREIVSLERSTAPFNLVLLLDVSGSVENYVNFIRKAARSFVETVDKNDKVSIVIFNDDVKTLSRFTTDKGKLSENLDTFDAGGGTAYYDALAYVISDTLRPLKGDRIAIVILTDGDDNRSFLAFDSLVGSIQESGALIYPLYVPSGLIAMAAQGTVVDIDPMRKKYMSLSAKSAGEGERLAKISGGVYYPITRIEHIQNAYEDIAQQLRSAYIITFRSKHTDTSGDGISPRLKIKVKLPNTYTTLSSVEVAP